MNLVLFYRSEIDRPLPLTDRRAKHVLDVLRRRTGETFDAGIVNGERGTATLVSIGDGFVHFLFTPSHPPTVPDPVTLIVGLPRPQTSRDMLRDATTLGIAALHFVVTEKSDANYAKSALWQDGEWERHVIAGAEQAFDTAVPSVRFGDMLATALAAIPRELTNRIALDNYEGAERLADCAIGQREPVALALGPERGWSAADRVLLRASGFKLAHLGARVMRAETALIAALTLVKSARGSL